MPEPGPPVGAITKATPLVVMAQVRDGIAMFGSGAVHLIELPLMGENALQTIAQISVGRSHASGGIATRIMLVEHDLTTG